MRRKRLLWRLYPSYLLVVIVSLLVVTGYASVSIDRSRLRQATDSLRVTGRLIEHHLEQQAPSLDAAHAAPLVRDMGRLTGSRITILLPSGAAIADSEADPAAMENHAGRPEVRQALAGKVGSDVRRSPTLQVPMLYVAVPATVHGRRCVIRTAASMADIRQSSRDFQVRIALAGLGVAVLAAVVCLLVSRRIARPLEEVKRGVERLARGELGHRLHVPPSEEIGSLAEVINDMAAQLEDRIRLITAQRNEQEAVFSSMIEGVIAVDAHERVLRMNQAAGALLAVAPADAQGKAIRDIVRNAPLRSFIAQALAGPAPVEGEVQLQENGDRWLQAHGALLHDAAGRTIGAVIVLTDLTRIRELENFRRDFVANVSHELRTPITCIKGFVETLLDGALREPESAGKFLAIIARQADRLNAIINDLLLLSRIEQQGEREPLAMDDVPIRRVVDAAVDLCRHKAAARSVEIVITGDDALHARVNAPLLEQAVVNLVDNAVKYSDPGKPVSVETFQREDTVAIVVRDQGCGIEKEHLPRIFERFYRVDRGRSREMGGTGLGLSIVKHIAQAHGGHVSVISTPGKGSTFTITLPQAGPPIDKPS